MQCNLRIQLWKPLQCSLIIRYGRAAAGVVGLCQPHPKNFHVLAPSNLTKVLRLDSYFIYPILKEKRMVTWFPKLQKQVTDKPISFEIE